MTQPEQGSFSIKTLGEVIAKALGLRPGDSITIQRDRLNGDRVMVIRGAEEPGSSA